MKIILLLLFAAAVFIPIPIYAQQQEKSDLEIAETAADPRTKLQARAIANDCYKYIMEMPS